MLTHDAFLGLVEGFLERSKMSPTAFGKEAVGDPNLVRELRDGRSPSLHLVERVGAFIRQQEEGPGAKQSAA